jgi:hypothetical protein
VPSSIEQIVSRSSANSVKEVLQAEKHNYDVLVKGRKGRYKRVDVGIEQPIPCAEARPEAG